MAFIDFETMTKIIWQTLIRWKKNIVFFNHLNINNYFEFYLKIGKRNTINIDSDTFDVDTIIIEVGIKIGWITWQSSFIFFYFQETQNLQPPSFQK